MFRSVWSSPLFRQYASVLVVNLSMVSVGLGLAWPSPVVVKLRNPEESPLKYPVTEEEISWLVSIGSLVALVANLGAPKLLDCIGRKKGVICGMLPRIVVGFMFLFSTEIYMLLVARVLSGLSDTILFSVVPLYAAEIASKEIRGSLGTILQVSCSLGIVIMLSMGPFVSYITLNIVYTALSAIGLLPLFIVPDSPYFLFSKGRKDQALDSLTFLRGSETQALEEIREFEKTDDERKGSVKSGSFVKSRIFIKSLILIMILGIGGQIIGFNAISFYLQTVLESTKTSVKPEISSVIIGLIQLAASFCTTLVSDRFGRKPILATTLVGIAIGMLGLGTFFHIRDTSGEEVTGFMNYVPLISLIVVVFCYSAGPGSLNWLLSAELFDGPVRSYGVTAFMTLSTLFLFLTTKYFAAATAAIGTAFTYYIFCVNSVLYCLFIMFCIPETKGKSIREIQVSLGMKVEAADA